MIIPFTLKYIHTRKRKQKSLSVDKHLGKKASKKEAEKLLNDLLQKRNEDDYFEPTNMSLGEYLVGWLRDYAKPNLTPQTYNSYAIIVTKHLVPKLGHIPLPKLHPMHIQKYYSEALISGRTDGKGGLSPRTVKFHHAVLHEALQHALKLQMVLRNPTAAVTPPRQRRYQSKVPIEETLFALIAAAYNDKDLKIPVLLAVGTGMRRGEVLGLQWKNTDLKTGLITVCQALQITDNGLIFAEPKTDRSRRSIVIPPDLIKELKQHRKLQLEHQLSLGSNYKEHDLVVSLPDGGICHPSTFSYHFRLFLKKNKLPPTRFHDLRHAHATLLLKLGIHPKIVSERLGHSTITLTLDTYSHVLPNMQQEAAEKINDFLINKKRVP